MIPIVVPSDNDFRWVLRYSAPTFFLLVLWHCWSVWLVLPMYQKFFAGFGADLPLDTTFMLNYYWVGGVAVAVPSLLSAAFLLLRSDAPIKQQKVAYCISLGALVAAFLWSGLTISAMTKVVKLMSSAI